MTKPASERATTTPWSSLEPYTQLLRALLPRMNSLSVFDPQGHLHWSSEMSVAPEIASVVAQAVKDGREPGSAGVQRMVGAEPFYFFWLMADEPGIDALPFVVVAIGFKQTRRRRAALVRFRARAGQARARVPAARTAGAS